MNAKATINCSCGCLFDVSFSNSRDEMPPKCPCCHAEMDGTSWKSLRSSMAELIDFNYHILKWNAERNEPKMIVPTVTVQTYCD